MSRTAARVLAVVALVAVLVAIGAAAYVGLGGPRPGSPSSSNANGTGLTYQGRFYWASSDVVAPAALGDQVASAVAFQDRTADLRAIDGFDPEIALAALLPSLDGTPGGDRWTFVSTDQDRGTNPAGYPDSAAVLAPTP